MVSMEETYLVSLALQYVLDNHCIFPTNLHFDKTHNIHDGEIPTYSECCIELQRLNQTDNEKYFMKIVNSFVEGLSEKFYSVFEKIHVHLFLYIIQRNHFLKYLITHVLASAAVATSIIFVMSIVSKKRHCQINTKS